MNKLMPIIYIGHGSPMNAIEDNPFTESLIKLGKELDKPKAILVISAHWVTQGMYVTESAEPEQIYDFYGFPEELYLIKYKVKGSPSLAKRVCGLFKDNQVNVSSDWGIDHGAWTVLKYLFPKADVPVIQLSLDYAKNEQEHLLIGEKLNILRQEGVLIIGSGNLVHNLNLISGEKNDEPFVWAKKFDEETKKNLLTDNRFALANYDGLEKEIKEMSVPTNEHYLPMLYIVALRQKNEILKFIYEGFDYKAISMRSFIIS